ncbi:MAG: phytanoyl-CoA dioxygenase family protein [Kiloniellales bacterium]|nr:phytanoyl-CoA dioxygenase family protein [Kiloniellales bacterium]
MKEFYPSDCEMDHPDRTTEDNFRVPFAQALRNTWIEEGILRIPAVYDGPALAALRSALDQAATSGAFATRAGNRGLLEHSAPVRALAVSDPALALARVLIGDEARPVKATLFDKVAEANWTLPWHQDLTVALREVAETPGFSRWSSKSGVVHAEAPLGILRRMVALRLHLDDCDARNGPLLVVPGSHRRGKLGVAAREALPGQSSVRLCEARTGDILAMHPLLLHRSAPAETPSRRRVIHLEYAAASLPQGLSWRYDPLAEAVGRASSGANPSA